MRPRITEVLTTAIKVISGSKHPSDEAPNAGHSFLTLPSKGELKMLRKQLAGWCEATWVGCYIISINAEVGGGPHEAAEVKVLVGLAEDTSRKCDEKRVNGKMIADESEFKHFHALHDELETPLRDTRTRP
ncbi:hypothetical protein VZT92_008511 [Zoarces viviparus]|uniref:Uncharacterized protein n=1 Tax=Zoarces viviparus TaxID=48416 RepID=A0AAW1FFD1_ZOAVI